MAHESSTIAVHALTGVIGSGKSLVATMLEQHGAIILDADILAREVVLPETEGLRRITQEFGEKSLNRDGTLNREWLATEVFSDADKKRRLEAIIHPLIRGRFKEERDRIVGEQKQFSQPQALIYVAPLLFEANIPLEQFSSVIVVASSKERCLERITERDKLTREEALRRVESQLPIEKKIARADFVIMNNGSKEELEEQVKSLWSDLLKTYPICSST